ncbi:pyridoxal phosphate-dependent aminotransferase, partial [Caulobacter sp. HMWF025]|uniref:pyridoxal phosphate-dependent aminotransferase n=2 Tax=unclassified Caulobacter TaxID=2648921 RepID=UPI000D3A59A2
PYGPSPAARRAALKALDETPYYAWSLEPPLVEAIARREGVSPDSVGLCNGSLEALSLLSTVFSKTGPIVAPQPTYATPLLYAQRQGAVLDWIPVTADHQMDLPALAKKAAGAGCVYVCNPNNPTGLLADPDALRAFCIAASKSAPVIVDEAYIEISPDPVRHSMLDLVRDGHDVIVARTFSKVYGMAGLRVGFILARPERVRQLKSLIPTHKGRPGLAAALACYGDATYLAGTRAYLEGCREKIYAICKANGLTCLPSHATYVFVDTGKPNLAFQKTLASMGVEVRVFDSPAHPTWIRVGTASPAELDVFAQVLPQALKV